MDAPEYILTRERRRAVCVHEAGHAVVDALGGLRVVLVAVAPEGDGGTWMIDHRNGEASELQGVCRIAEATPHRMFMRWRHEECTWDVDRKSFCAHIRQQQATLAKRSYRIAAAYAADTRRMMRALVCGLVAGPAAEQIFRFPEDDLFLAEPLDDDSCDDISIAQACSSLLPYRNEYWHASELTEAALRRPDIWGRVMRLADELERVGAVTDGLDGFLPDPLPGWPSSPGGRAHRKAK